MKGLSLRRSTAELARRLTARGPDDRSWAPVGRGTRSAPLPDHVAPFPLEGFDSLEDLDREEMVLTAGAATPLETITHAAAEAGLVLCPLLPPGTSGTLGGLYASGIESPVAPIEGRVRDAVLGVEGVTGGGAPIRSGGRVVKNVTGYDLTRFLCGSRGTLAVITRLHWRLRQAAESFREVRGTIDPERLLPTLTTLRTLPDPTALRLELDGGRIEVRALVEGDRPSARLRAERIAQGWKTAELESGCDPELVILAEEQLARFLAPHPPAAGDRSSVACDATSLSGEELTRDTARGWVDRLVSASVDRTARAVVFPWIGLGTLRSTTDPLPSPAVLPDPMSRAIRAAWDPNGNLWDGRRTP